ncbi:unnamed protein product [Sphenostylis stenocarpa]|uniref:Uncharacterized protein n=1 Tax=Sphenostylis stenocarpa TaxID=92480 RepID=A0AA86S3S6_9FABA|nr:unnamed protein product [Sphenostylis stenocarpa]
MVDKKDSMRSKSRKNVNLHVWTLVLAISHINMNELGCFHPSNKYPSTWMATISEPFPQDLPFTYKEIPIPTHKFDKEIESAINQAAVAAAENLVQYHQKVDHILHMGNLAHNFTQPEKLIQKMQYTNKEKVLKKLNNNL